MKKRVSVLIVIFIITSLLTSGIVQAATVKISKAKATMEVDSTLKLKITGTKAKVTWSSSKKSVATVSSAGTITAKAEGAATITATVSNKKYTCKVTVVNSNKVKTTPKPTPDPNALLTPVPEPELSSDKELLTEKEIMDLTINPTKYLGKYAEFVAQIATDPVSDSSSYSCLIYQDAKNKSKIISIRGYDNPELKKGDNVLVFGYIDRMYSGPGVDGNTIEAPNIIVKGIEIIEGR